MRLIAHAMRAATASALVALCASRAAAATLVVPDVQAACGQQVQVPLHVQGAASLETFGLQLQYENDCFEFVSVAPGTATGAWAGVEASENTPGVVTVGGFRGSAAAFSGDAEIAVLTFACKTAACPCASPLVPGALVSGVENYAVEIGFASCGAGNNCAVVATPGRRTFGLAGGQGTIDVDTPAGCPWVATESTDWIAINGADSGVGDGQVAYTVAAFDGESREGEILVSGVVHRVVQTSETVVPLIVGAVGFADISAADAESTFPDGTTRTGFVAQEKKLERLVGVDLSGLEVDANQAISGFAVVQEVPAKGIVVEIPVTGRLTFKQTLQQEGGGAPSGGYFAKAALSGKRTSGASVSLKASSSGTRTLDAKAIVGFQPAFAASLKASDGTIKGASRAAFDGWFVEDAVVGYPAEGPAPNGSPASSWTGQGALVTPFEEDPVVGGTFTAKTKWAANGKPGKVDVKATVGGASATLKGTTDTTAAEAAAAGFAFQDADIAPTSTTFRSPGASSKTTFQQP